MERQTTRAASPWPDARAREEERRAKREAVLVAAVRSFNARGFRATSLDDVAAELNVTKPTIYYYYASKDEILFECVARGLDYIRSAAEEGVAEGGSGAERLRALMTGYALMMTEDFGICVSRTLDSELTPEGRARFRALKRDIDQLTRRVVEEGMADGSLRAGDPRMVTFTLTGALNWIARWYRPDAPMSAREVAKGVVDTLMRGLLP